MVDDQLRAGTILKPVHGVCEVTAVSDESGCYLAIKRVCDR